MKRARLLFVLGFTAVSVGALSCSDDDITPTGPAPQVFNLSLTGAAERPTPVTTTASGTAKVIIYASDSIELILRLTGIDSATASHFHVGDSTVAGGIMFGIFAGPATGLAYSGELVHGHVQRGTGGFTGVYNFDSLLTRIRAGTAYLNVHTRRNPGGELRAQVR